MLAEIMAGNASEVEIAGVLIALRTKGETVRGARRPGRDDARAVDARRRRGRDDLVDTAGTGGGRPTFNVSTTAALIAAGAGCAVAKHGNRSATGLSGSADVLEALGARIDLAPGAVARCIDEAGFGFMFAPAHHQATRFVVPVRKELAVRTIFNFLGPLTNPAGARRQLIGVSDPALPRARSPGALARLGVDRALVVSSAGWPRRDEHLRRRPTSSRSTATRSSATTSRPRTSASPRPTPRRRRRRHARATTPPTARAIFAGETGPRARPRAAQRRRRDLRRRAAPTRSPRASRPPREAIDSGAARARLERYVAPQPGARASRDERAGAHRRRDARRTSRAAASEVPLAELERAPRRRAARTARSPRR